jgi:hypothetical protein
MMSDPDNTSSDASPLKKQKSSDNTSEDNNQENFFYQEIFYQGIICKLINILLSDKPNLDLLTPLLTEHQRSIQTYIDGRITELDAELIVLQAQKDGLQTATESQLVSPEIQLSQEIQLSPEIQLSQEIQQQQEQLQKQLQEKIDLTTKNQFLINSLNNSLKAILGQYPLQNIDKQLLDLLNGVKDLFCPEDGSYKIDNACVSTGDAEQILLCSLFNELCNINYYILPVLYSFKETNDPFAEVAKILTTPKGTKVTGKNKKLLVEHFNKMLSIIFSEENPDSLMRELTGLLQTSNDFVDPPMKALLYFIQNLSSYSILYVVELFYVFSDSINEFCTSEKVDKIKDDNYITLIHTLYYDVFCNTDLQRQQQLLQQQQQLSPTDQFFVKFMNDNLNTFTIELTAEGNPRDIVLIPHFIGVLVMLMTEIKHDFESVTIKEKKENKKAVDLKFIKEMVRFLLKEYATEALSPNPFASTLISDVDIIGKINYFFSTEGESKNVFDYLNEEGCQKIMLEIYNLKKIICVQEKPGGNYYVSSKPEKIISQFPTILAKNKKVILSADAKNTLGISINSITNLYKLKTEQHPFLNFDAGNASNIEEQEEAGEEGAIPNNEKLTTLKNLTSGSQIRYNIYVRDLWGEHVFGIEMYLDTVTNKWMFRLGFLTNRGRLLDNICNELNSLGPFADVSITKVASLYNSAYGIITKKVPKLHNLRDLDLKKALYNILVSIISLKSMGDLLTYYVTLIEGVDNADNYVKTQTTTMFDFKKEIIGVVSSADFSLMQLPLVKIMIPNTTPNTTQIEQQFIPYVPPCSLFASVHIKGSEYVVPLNDEERFKIVLWEYISNRYSISPTIQNPSINVFTTSSSTLANDKFNPGFNYLCYFIDYFYDIYWNKLNPENWANTNSNLLASLTYYFTINNTKIFFPQAKNGDEQKNDEEYSPSELIQNIDNLNFCLVMRVCLNNLQEKQKVQQEQGEQTDYKLLLLIDMVKNAVCECESYTNFKSYWDRELNNDICSLLKSFYPVITTCFVDCNEAFQLSNLCADYFSNEKFNIKYDDGEENINTDKNYFVGKINGENSTITDHINITYDIDNTSVEVPIGYLKHIFYLSANIESKNAKMYSLAEYGVYCVPNSTSTMAPADHNDFDDLGGGNGKKFIGNKNTKTYKKKYIKNKINKTRGNKNINNKMNNTRSNKKLNKKHTNTLRKK